MRPFVFPLALLACSSPPPPGRPDDVPMSCASPTVRTFRIDDAHLPATSAEARAVGFPLLRTGAADNELGSAFAAAMTVLTGYAPTPGQALGASVDWRIEIATCDDGNEARVRVGQPGGDDPRAVGSTSDGVYLADQGCAMIPLGTLTDAVGGAPPGWVTADLLAVDLRGDTELTGNIGMLLAGPPAAIAIADAVAPFLTKNLAAGVDTGELKDADTNGDNVITSAELQAWSTYKSLVATDASIGNLYDVPRCPTDVTTWLSVGLAVHATAL